MKLRVGLLGCGDFAQRHAQIVLTVSERVELVAFCDRNEWKARAFAEKFASTAQVFTDHHEMFARGGLNVVIICLPPSGHTDEVSCAADHGIHILMEKPIALTSADAWRMVEVVERAKIKTQVGFMLRFGEAVERWRACQEEGRTGPVGLMTARYFCNALHAPWWRRREKSGGQLVEQAIHLFDLMRYIVGEPAAVFAKQANLFHHDVPDYTIEDVSTTLLTFPNGGLGVISATNAAIPGKWIHDYRLVAQRMTVDFRSVNQASFYITDQAGAPVTEVDSNKDFRRDQLLDLLDAIETERATRTPMREGARSLDLVLAAQASAATGVEIKL